MTNLGRLSQDAEAVASTIARATDLQKRLSATYSPKQLAAMTGLSPTDLNDAVDELRSAGLVTMTRIGACQHEPNFIGLEPRHGLYYGFFKLIPGELDPKRDPVMAAVAIAKLDEATEPQLMQELGWPLGRVTIAVAGLEASNEVTVYPGEGGRPPVGFYKVRANAGTRRLAKMA